MSEIISLTPTIQATLITEDDLLSPDEVAEVLRTIPEGTLAHHDLVSATDTPEDAIKEGDAYADSILSVERMKREGYTISNKSDFYWFGHRKWSSRGGKKPIRVVWHHMAGNLTPKQFLAIMQSSRQMSPTISIHTDGTVYAWVPEEMRPWTTGSYAADQQALTFELANDQIGGQWHLSDKVIDLAAQIHAEWSKRYGIPTTYSYRGAGINMHKDWANTACPGPYLEGLIKNGTITRKINAYLNPPAPKPTVKKQWIVQAGAFEKKTSAVDMKVRITSKTNGRTGKKFDAFVKSENGMHKVRCGTFENESNAVQLMADLKKYVGLKNYEVVIIPKEVKA